MLTVGNDIVDLAVNEPELHPRFASRVCTDKERACIGQDTALLWLHWAAKEAAYKALKRLNAALAFIPNQFEYDHTTDTVHVGDIELFCRSIVTVDYAFVSCVNRRTSLGEEVLHDWIQQTDPNERLDLKTHSQSVRELAVRNVARHCHVPEHEITIISQIRGGKPSKPQGSSAIPLLRIADSDAQALISFTHHGRYIACSYLGTSTAPALSTAV